LKKYLILLALIFLFIVPVKAEEQPEYYEQIYLSEKEALDLVFAGLEIEKKEVEADKQKLKTIQKRLKRKISENKYTFYIGKKEGKEKKYALILEEKGKHFPITFIVGINEDLQVDKVAVMIYREKRGDAVKRKRFLKQFEAKSSQDPLEVNQDIIHLTGSTISSWSMAAGVKKALVLTEELIKR